MSCGTVASAKLLLLSGVGPAPHLNQVLAFGGCSSLSIIVRHAATEERCFRDSDSFQLGIPVSADLPVGENLQDHLTTTLGPFILDNPVGFNPLSLLSPYTHLQVKLIVQSYCLVSLCLSINHCND